MKNMLHMSFLFSAVVALHVVSPATAGQATAGVTLGVPTTNNAVRLDADSDYLEIPSTSTFPVAGDASFTIEMWFNMDSLPSSGAALAGWGNEGYALMTYLAVNPDGNLWFTHWGIDNLYSAGLATGVWTHVAAVHDGVAHTDYVYVNGVLIGSNTVPVLNVVRTKLRLGQHPNVPSYGFRGSMDEVRLWSVVRSPEEIAGAMNQTLPGAVAGLDARWSMDEGVGTQANDTAGGNHHAAFNGTPAWGMRGELATTLNQTYDGTARIVGAMTQPAGLHVDITYDGNPWGPTNAGSYAVTGTVVDLTYQGWATGTLVVAKAAQTITFENPGPQVTTNVTPIVATASSGLPVTLAVISGPATLSSTLSSATIGFISRPPTTLSPATLTYTGAGDVTIAATQAGGANWETATTETNTFTVSLTPQAVLGFTPTSPQTYNTTNALSVSGGSGTGAVSYEVSSGPGTIVDGSNLWVSSGTGTITVVATKAQDDLYLSTSITSTVAAAKAAQSIGFPNPGPQVTTNVTSLSASASSGLPVTLEVISGPATLSSIVSPRTLDVVSEPPTTLSPATLTYTGTGDVTIAATQVGDANWEAATTETNTFTVSLTPQAVLGFTPTSPQSFNTTNALSVSGGSGTGEVSYAVSSGPGAIVGGTNLRVSAGTGTVTVVATKAQDDLYLATSTTSTVAAAKAVQSIIFDNPGPQVTTNVTPIVATASSGLPVTLKVISGPATLSATVSPAMIGFISRPPTTVSPATLTYSGTGDVTIAATQAGDANWEAALPVTNTFTVSQPVQPELASPVHRFWSDSMKSHFFTASEAEKNSLITSQSKVWTYEGIAFYAHTQAQEDTQPVHRFWSERLGAHLFTISDKEKAQLESRFPKAFMHEGYAFHAFNDQALGTLPVYRFWNPLLKRLFFTISEDEKANVIASKIWRFEGIAWYAYPTANIAQPPIPTKQDQFATQADMPPQGSVIDLVGAPASEVSFSLSYDSNSVVEATLYDPGTNGFTQVLAPTVAPHKLEIPSLPAGQRYWLSVMSRQNDEEGAMLDYGGWLGKVAEMPEDAIETVEEGAEMHIGLPVETIALPESKGTLALRLYEPTGAGDDRLIVTRTGLKGGSTCELAVPAWNSWYRVEIADETSGVALESFWIGHLRTH